MNWKPESKRKLWAMKRNWLIKRLRGAHSIFSGEGMEFIRTLIPKEEWVLLNTLNSGIGRLVNKVSESKWKE